MIFAWKNWRKGARALPPQKALSPPFDTFQTSSIHFQNVSLGKSIRDFSIEIPPSSRVILGGDNEFAKALFCDLCFGYIQPESGKVDPALSGVDVSFLGRSNTTYGRSVIDHLTCGVRLRSKEQLHYVAENVLSTRFHRLTNPENRLQFREENGSNKIEMDERDFLEIAEANLLLQNRPAAVIDANSDFYQKAIEQGYKHSDAFLNSGKITLWLIGNSSEHKSLPPKLSKQQEINLYFPLGSHLSYIN